MLIFMETAKYVHNHPNLTGRPASVPGEVNKENYLFNVKSLSF